ncbi:hypothetical protein ASG99_12335 [Bacillus sp. Soil768D1]|nr:hypothetical protein ASG99_12335 [Bacillus sp. Soil768D1]
MRSKSVPDIRFAGFDGEWEERKLKEVSTYSNGGSYENDVLKEGKYELVTLKSVDMNGNLVSSGKYIDLEVPTLKKGTLVMILSEQSPGLLGMTAQIPESNKYVLNQRVAEVLPNDDIYEYFLSMAININQQYFSKRGAGTKVQNISKPNVENYEFFVPCFKEQTQVGNFFKQLDEAIALQQQELDTLKQTKQGFLQKMFPKEGESVPEIRFAGFDEEWEERKFIDFISKSGKKNTSGGDYPAYSVSNKLGLISQTEQFEGSRLDSLDKTSYKIVNPNEFAYNPARINVGSIAFNNLNETVIVSSLYVILRMSRKLDNEFILQYINSQTFIDEVRRNTEGSVREYLFFENFKNIKFPYVENKEEQIQIGQFFKQLDDTIALQQKELDALKEMKKAFLQKMFV